MAYAVTYFVPIRCDIHIAYIVSLQFSEREKLVQMMKAMHIQPPSPPSSAASIRTHMRYRPAVGSYAG